jgi:hypothetical protein
VTFSPARTARTFRILAVVLAILSLIVMRVLMSAREELASADAAFERADLESAVVHYRRAARWYVPASPIHVRALAKLESIGQAAERAGDTELALSAYRSVRGSIMAVRSFYVPERARLSRANQRIALLMAEQPAPGMDLGKSKAQIQSEHLALLQREPGPSVLWTIVLLVGFFSWVFGAFVFSARAIDEHDRWVVAEAKKWSIVIALGFGLFVLGMALA